jgi:hypothetical protein
MLTAQIAVGARFAVDLDFELPARCSGVPPAGRKI